MKKMIHALSFATALSIFSMQVRAEDNSAAVATSTATDSAVLEKSLQGLDWNQFRTVVESIPKLKADVDAYGPLGWQYVQANYRNYGWKRNIDKLDDEQKRQLASLIESAKKTR